MSWYPVGRVWNPHFNIPTGDTWTVRRPIINFPLPDHVGTEECNLTIFFAPLDSGGSSGLGLTMSPSTADGTPVWPLFQTVSSVSTECSSFRPPID